MNANHEAWFKIFRERAKSLKRHIVLPEGVDDRTLIAAHKLLLDGICRVTWAIPTRSAPGPGS